MMIKINFHYYSIMVSLSLLLVINACTGKPSMEYKQLFFKVDIALVEDSLAKLVLPERIDLFGTGPKEGQTGVSKIEARIINSKMEPGDNTQLKELCRSFAIRVRNLLQEPNSFDEYYISFDREVTKGTATTRDYRQVKFLVKDL